MSAYGLEVVSDASAHRRTGQTNGPCAANFVLRNGSYFIFDGNLIVLPGDRSREGFQRSRRYTNNLSDAKCRICHSSMNATVSDKAIAEEVSGLIERVTFHNDENGFCVLRVKVRGHRDEVTVLGSLPSVTAGEWLEAEGWWVRDKEHGLQFKARLMKTVPPTTVEGIERYLSSGLVKGIGPVLAKKLVGRFGAEVLGVIENRVAELQSVDGIGPKRRQRIE